MNVTSPAAPRPHHPEHYRTAAPPTLLREPGPANGSGFGVKLGWAGLAPQEPDELPCSHSTPVKGFSPTGSSAVHTLLPSDLILMRFGGDASAPLLVVGWIGSYGPDAGVFLNLSPAGARAAAMPRRRTRRWLAWIASRPRQDSVGRVCSRVPGHLVRLARARSSFVPPGTLGVMTDGVGSGPGEAPVRRAGEWKRRYVANVAGLRSGNRDQIAEVVNVLAERDRQYGLSQGERRMLDRAIELLAGITGGGS